MDSSRSVPQRNEEISDKRHKKHKVEMRFPFVLFVPFAANLPVIGSAEIRHNAERCPGPLAEIQATGSVAGRKFLKHEAHKSQRPATTPSRERWASRQED